MTASFAVPASKSIHMDVVAFPRNYNLIWKGKGPPGSGTASSMVWAWRPSARRRKGGSESGYGLISPLFHSNIATPNSRLRLSGASRDWEGKECPVQHVPASVRQSTAQPLAWLRSPLEFSFFGGWRHFEGLPRPA